MKYEKPDVSVIDFLAMQKLAYIPENNGFAAPASDTEDGKLVSGEGTNQERG